MNNISKDIIISIACNLDIKDISAWMLCSNKFNRCLSTEYLWKYKVEHDYNLMIKLDSITWHKFYCLLYQQVLQMQNISMTNTFVSMNISEFSVILWQKFLIKVSQIQNIFVSRNIPVSMNMLMLIEYIHIEEYTYINEHIYINGIHLHRETPISMDILMLFPYFVSKAS